MLIAACCVSSLLHVGEAKFDLRVLCMPCVLWSFLLGASSLLPLRRGERAPERSNDQAHGWHAGPFCCWREERSRLPSLTMLRLSPTRTPSAFKPPSPAGFLAGGSATDKQPDVQRTTQTSKFGCTTTDTRHTTDGQTYNTYCNVPLTPRSTVRSTFLVSASRLGPGSALCPRLDNGTCLVTQLAIDEAWEDLEEGFRKHSGNRHPRNYGESACRQ